VQRVRDVEPLQQDRGVALGRVAVLLADDALELAEAHAVGVGHVGLRVERVALLERVQRRALPMITVSMTRWASKANWSWRSTPSFGGTHDRALLRVELARQELHERRLAGAVRPREAVAPTRGERRR
jgi:hypothetical protein